MIKRIWEQRGVSLAMRFAFRLLDYFWPKDESMIVFSGGRDVGYADNSRYLFEKFVESYSEEFTVRWVTPSKNMLFDEEIEESFRGQMVYQYSSEGIQSLLRAKVIFFSWKSSDLPGTDFSRRTITVQLWHGIPIKRIGLCSKRLDEGDVGSVGRACRKFTYWICNSRVEQESIALCTSLPIDRVKITGYPRNDYLIEHRNSRDAKLIARYPFLQKRVILYAPTWRANSTARFFPFDDFSESQLISFLEENDAYLILRTHHVDDLLAPNGVVSRDGFRSDRIVTLNRDTLRDVQDILPYVSILISDYSGIWVDFLLLNRPIIFVPYDLEAYEDSEGLLYDYDYVTPGPKVSSFGEFMSAIQAYSSDSSRDSGRREDIKRMFHEHEDGMAYLRIYQLIKGAISDNH